MPYIRQDVTFYRIHFAALTEKEGKRNAPINVNPVGGGGGGGSASKGWRFDKF